MSDMSDLIANIRESLKEDSNEGPDVTPVMLMDAYERYNMDAGLKPGDIVRFKAGMAAYKQPNPYGVVVEILDEPVLQGGEMDHANCMEKLDIVIGTYTNDGMFRTWPFNSKRFEKVEVEDVI